jgi:hypothetical protein
MKPKRKSRIWLISTILLLVIAIGGSVALAQEAEPGTESIATTRITTTMISWTPTVANSGFVLTISGPGEVYFQEEFYGSADPSLKLKDNKGGALPDGSYTYELLALPAGGTQIRESMDEMELTGGASGESRLQSGSFSILDGRFVTQDVTEAENLEVESINPGVTPSDQVILDDLIVDGSACVGVDCVNGESFGFDTIRLKENNLRIKFQDTSSTASFPTNDWTILANDSANGGASYFGVYDVDAGRRIFSIEAGAPAHSLFVEDSGQIGLGTSTPAVELHIKEGDTPTVRLQQDGSSGWAPQTWDVAGNETNFFIRDATNGSKLPFRIQPNTPGDSLTLTDDGVGVGTWTPSQPLHVYRSDGSSSLLVEETSGTTTVRNLLRLKNNGGPRITFLNTNTSVTWIVGSTGNDRFALTKNGSGETEFQLTGNGNLTISGTLTENSDFNKKENFSTVDNQEVLARLAEVPITTWNIKEDGEEVRHMGPMAQDFYAAFELGEDDVHLAPLDANGVAFAAIQALNEIVEEKDAEIASLEARLVALEEAAGIRSKSGSWVVTVLPWVVITTLLVFLFLRGKRFAGEPVRKDVKKEHK